MYQHSTYPTQPPTFPYNNNSTNLPPVSSSMNKASAHDPMGSPHHPLARPASLPSSYYPKYPSTGNNNGSSEYPYGNTNNNEQSGNANSTSRYGFGATTTSSTSSSMMDRPVGDNNTSSGAHYDSPVPRNWQQPDPFRDYSHHENNTDDGGSGGLYHTNSNNSHESNNNNNSGSVGLPTSLPTPTGIATLSYGNNSNNNASGGGSSYFAPPPPTTPVPPSASASSTSSSNNNERHLYHPYANAAAGSRRHSASNSSHLGYSSSSSHHSSSYAGLPSFGIPPPPARHALVPRPKLTTTLWEDEGTICYQVDANGICVARRHDNDMINGTKLLNVAGMSRGKRDGILKNEKGRVVVKVGAMHLKGVWITFHRAKTLATQYKIVDILQPLFVDNPSNYLYASPIHHAHHHSHAAAAAAAGIAGLPPAGSASTPAGSRIDSGFSSSTASGPSGAFRHTGGLAAAATTTTGTEPHHHHHHHHPSSSSPFQPPHQGLRPMSEQFPPATSTAAPSASSLLNNASNGASSNDVYNFEYRGESSPAMGGLVSSNNNNPPPPPPQGGSSNLSNYHLYHQQSGRLAHPPPPPPPSAAHGTNP